MTLARDQTQTERPLNPESIILTLDQHKGSLFEEKPCYMYGISDMPF